MQTDTFTVVIGVIILIYGLYNLYASISGKSKAQGLTQATLGEGAGKVIFYISRVVLPVLVGAACVWLAFVAG